MLTLNFSTLFNHHASLLKSENACILTQVAAAHPGLVRNFWKRRAETGVMRFDWSFVLRVD
jgi:hypothetical protein